MPQADALALGYLLRPSEVAPPSVAMSVYPVRTLADDSQGFLKRNARKVSIVYRQKRIMLLRACHTERRRPKNDL